VLEVLARIPARAIPKAAGWWRVMFSGSSGDGGPDYGSGSVARHALDFRVLTGSRVALFDASQSLFRNAPPRTHQSQSQSQEQQQQDSKSSVLLQQSGAPPPSSAAAVRVVGFRPIPELGSAVYDAVVAGRGRGTVAGIGIGVVCGAADVVVVGEAFWRSVARRVSSVLPSGGGDVVVKMEEGD